MNFYLKETLLYWGFCFVIILILIFFFNKTPSPELLAKFTGWYFLVMLISYFSHRKKNEKTGDKKKLVFIDEISKHKKKR